MSDSQPKPKVLSVRKKPRDYEELISIWDKAISAKKGVRLDYGSKEQATRGAMLLNIARSYARDLTESIYHVGDARYGKTPYDEFTVIRDRERPHIVLITPKLPFNKPKIESF